MNRDTLKQIMIDQKESYLNNPLIPRKYFLEENVNYCFVGIRRTGKSYMMYQKIQSLIEKGVPRLPNRICQFRGRASPGNNLRRSEYNFGNRNRTFRHSQSALLVF